MKNWSSTRYYRCVIGGSDSKEVFMGKELTHTNMTGSHQKTNGNYDGKRNSNHNKASTREKQSPPSPSLKQLTNRFDMDSQKRNHWCATKHNIRIAREKEKRERERERERKEVGIKYASLTAKFLLEECL